MRFHGRYFRLCVLLALNAVAFSQTTIDSTAPTMPAPIEFPRNVSDYTFLVNSTIRDSLEQHTNGLESEDMNRDATLDVNAIGKMVFTEENMKNVLQQDSRKEDSELIQADGNGEVEASEPTRGRAGPVVHGQLAAILAGIFVVIAVAAYAALLSWRRFLENRYGNREMLVNEEEFNEPNDGNFSL